MRASGNRSHSFGLIPEVQMPRSVFNRSSSLKTAFDGGDLVPIFVDEVIPGDTFNMSMSHYCRMATPIKPFFDNVHVDTFFFFVPTRLVWDNFQEFMGEEVSGPGNSTERLMPILAAGDYFTEESIFDYFGIPPLSGGYPTDYGISALPFRAYNLIWNEWFRDQNLQNPVPVLKDDGPDDGEDLLGGGEAYQLLKRGKRHDYFTASLPFLQKGDAVTLPLGGTAPLVGAPGIVPNNPPVLGEVGSPTTAQLQVQTGTGPRTVQWNATAGSGGPHVLEWKNESAPGFYVDLATGYASSPAPYADLSTATAATINAIRTAFQLQRLYERDARGGTRYTEIIRSHFGVISPDQRLQRPEYLGGYSTTLNVNPVAQTSETTVNSEQANLSAFVTGAHAGRGWNKSFTEHGYIIGVVNVRADLSYQQGINKMWTRRTRFDHFWPSLAHLGEQAIESREIYADGTGSEASGTGDWSVFGYIPRYDEYRYKPSNITGVMRSTHSAPLDVWHLAQNFSTRPVLNEEFISEDPPFDRVQAVANEPEFLFDAWFDLKCVRPMPTFGTPGLVDHF